MTASNIKIDRQRVIDTFAAYVKNYNSEDTKVKLKIEHTYRVAGLCQLIGQSIGLKGADLDIAWLDRKSTRLNSSHRSQSRMPSSA